MRRKKKRAEKTNSLLTSYVISYMGLALMSCTLIGALFFSSFIGDFIDINKKNLQDKMTLAVEDLENQLDTLGNISYSISASNQYWPYYLEQDHYNEKEMLEDFQRFSTYSPLTSEYFMIYLKDPEKVYRSVGSTSLTRSLLVSKYQVRNPSQTMEQLINVQSTSVIDLGADLFLLCYPIRFSSGISESPRAVIAFVCTRSAVMRRVTTVTGGFSESYDLTLADLSICSPDTELDEAALCAVSPDGRFQMRMDSNANSVLSDVSALQGMNILILVLGLAALLGISLVMAFRHFEPIRNLYEQFGLGKAEKGTKNELEGISTAIRGVLADNQRINEQLLQQTEQLRSQSELLRGQTLRALIDGSYDDRMRYRLSLLHIDLEDRQLASFLVRFRTDLPETVSADRLASLVEGLSDEDVNYYCMVQPHNTGIAVIAAMPDDQRIEAKEMIAEVLNAKNVDAVICFGGLYTEPEHLSLSFVEATEAVQREVDPSNSVLLTDRAAVVTEAVTEASHGNAARAMELVDQLSEALHRSADSMLLQRYVYADIAGALMRAAREAEQSISTQQISMMIVAQDADRFCRLLHDAIDSICAEPAHADDPADAQKSAQLIDYINAHYAEYDLSLEQLSVKFDLSVSHLSRLIKKITGNNYRDYVIRLKINQAKEYLAQGVSVAATNDLIGYSNISHFIKTFKKLEGVTPSVYQRTHQAGTAADQPTE